MTKSQGIYPADRFWTPEQTAVVVRLYADTPTKEIAEQLGFSEYRVYSKARALGIKKSAAFMSTAAVYRATNPPAKWVEKRFQKGHSTWNKGMKGIYLGGNEARFKPGNRSGQALLQWQPIGAERISKDGYLERKINDDKPFHRRWRSVHLLVWEEANGPLPDGYAVTFKDGDKRNVALENLQLTTRQELMTRNSVHKYGPEIAELCRIRGAIARQIKEKT